MSRGTIRIRTMWALFAVGGLAALLVGMVTTVTMTLEVYRQVGAANRGLARVLVAHVGEEIRDGEALLERVTAKVRGMWFDEVNLDPVLADALHFHPIFDSIYGYAPDGQVVIRRYADGKGEDEGRSKSLQEKSDREFVAQALATLKDGRTRKLPVRLTSRGNLFIPILAATRGPDGAIKGVLSGAISAAGQGFQEMIQDMAPGHRGYVLLLDRTRRVLARTSHAPGVVGEEFAPELRERWGQLQLQRDGAVDCVAEAVLSDVALHVLVGIPRDEALEALPGVLTKIALTALLALVLAGLLGVWLSERLTGPIREVLEGIRCLGDGVLTHRIPVEGEDELAEVGRAFNRLAESLARNRMIEEFWNDPSLEDAGGEPGRPEPENVDD